VAERQFGLVGEPPLDLPDRRGRVEKHQPASATPHGLSLLGLPGILACTARDAVGPERNDFERDFILEQVRMSILLHRTTRMFLMSHSDCATYGGLAAFSGDRDKEKSHHAGELHRGAQLLKASFPELDVEPYFVTFEGVFSPEKPAAIVSA